MPNMDQAVFFAERSEFDLREVTFPYSRKDGVVTISDEALAVMRAAPSINSVEVKGRELLSVMTDEELKQADQIGLAFLERPAPEKFMAAKRRFLGRPYERTKR